MQGHQSGPARRAQRLLCTLYDGNMLELQCTNKQYRGEHGVCRLTRTFLQRPFAGKELACCFAASQENCCFGSSSFVPSHGVSK